MLIDYLVTSGTRRKLLRALVSLRGERSVHELARRAGVGYASAHNEVKRLRELGLVSMRPKGAATLCLWRSAHRNARLVKRLLRAGEAAPPGSGRSRSDLNVLLNLKRWGAPLARLGSPSRPLGLEETLARAMTVARRDATVALVIPVVLGRNLERLDTSKLERHARSLGEKRALGFFLTLSARLLKNHGLAKRAGRLRDRRVHAMEDFFKRTPGPRARALAGRRTPPLAREWRFRMNLPMTSFERTFRKFAKSA